MQNKVQLKSLEVQEVNSLIILLNKPHDQKYQENKIKYFFFYLKKIIENIVLFIKID